MGRSPVPRTGFGSRGEPNLTIAGEAGGGGAVSAGSPSTSLRLVPLPMSFAHREETTQAVSFIFAIRRSISSGAKDPSKRLCCAGVETM